jgi:hypothetical protein
MEDIVLPPLKQLCVFESPVWYEKGERVVSWFWGGGEREREREVY